MDGMEAFDVRVEACDGLSHEAELTGHPFCGYAIARIHKEAILIHCEPSHHTQIVRHDFQTVFELVYVTDV
jgi:hypothetical protein